ncbi:MAG: DUF1549 domain-containing protein, partial [Bryobacteraceae bacterium]|nr:DUF1549 domain-containing protein [Bryobacteraceae bacterium]
MRLITTLLVTAAAVFAAQPKVDFNRDVRPVLSDNCFQCHGPDENHRMAAVRFDTKDGAFAQTKRGALIVPGDPAKSLLFQRISHAQTARRMPPPTFTRSLNAKQIDTVKRWIEEGAEWQTHWAFNAPKRPELPVVADASSVRNEIDRFIQAKLERDKIVPAPEADRRTLLRRVSLDLTGLPPTREEVETFVKDRAPDAYEKQVDRLLRSPHYGERMAMEWLDVARYADTHGFHIDNSREMYPWRDWLIRAFNDNMPFDRFTTLQLAGDLVKGAGTEGKIASGFNRNHMINFEGGAVPEEYLVEYVADRAETTATAWMGLTMGCARCHSHKYDPISHKDYYSFFAFFNNVDEKGLDGRRGNAEPFFRLPTEGESRQEQEQTAAIGQREEFLKSPQVVNALRDWQASLAGKPVDVDHKDLLAHYDFDGSLIDSSGRYMHGRTLRGDPTFSSGQVSRAVNFDGQTLVTLGMAGDFERDQPSSIALWLRYGGSKLSVSALEKWDAKAGRGWAIRLEDSEIVDIQKRAAHVVIRVASRW